MKEMVKKSQKPRLFINFKMAQLKQSLNPKQNQYQDIERINKSILKETSIIIKDDLNNIYLYYYSIE